MAEMNDAIHSYLFEISGPFAQEATRALRGGLDPSAIKALSLTSYQAALNELGLKEILPDSLRRKYAGAFSKKDPKIVADMFPSGSEIFLAVLPFHSSGIPLEDLNPEKYFYTLVAQNGDVTRDFLPNPSHCHRLLPMEIQNQCSFRVPRYSNFPLPSEEDMIVVEQEFFVCFDALKSFIEIK